jgi:phosphatidylglycerol:prolipoprotein diacylglycerol transferase
VLPTLGQLGPFSFPTYTVLIDLGLAAALAWLYFRAPAGRGARRLDAGLAATVGAFTGARLVYVVVHGDYYLPHLEEILSFWQGGLSWPGAVAGGLLGAAWYCRRQHEPLGAVLDAAAVPMALLGLLGWSGCLAAGCAYGFEVTPGAWPGWLTSHAPDLYGLTLPRFPTQLLGMAWSGLALAAVWLASRNAARWPAGTLGALALALVALGMFALSFTRGDPAPRLGGTRLDVLGSGLVLALAALAWAMRRLRGPAAPAGNASEAPPTPTDPASTGNLVNP